MSQHELIKQESCLRSLTAFHNKVMNSVDEERAVDMVYLDVSKAFDSLPHLSYRYAFKIKWTKRTENWLNCQAQIGHCDQQHKALPDASN